MAPLAVEAVLFDAYGTLFDVASVQDVVGDVTVALQTGRLKIAPGLPYAHLLVQELLAFRMKIDLRTAHDSSEAWREGDHDDLVLAAALAIWHAERAGAGSIWFL